MKILFKYDVIWVVALAMTFVGCVADGDIDTTPKQNEIRLWAGIDKASVTAPSSRGNANSTSGILTPSSNERLRIGMVRIDELYSEDYPAFVNCGNDGSPNPIMAELDLPDKNNSYYRDINFLSSAQFFYTATDIVRFAAWYPYDGSVYESTAEKTTVTLPITGDVDVMYGNVSSGSQTNGFEVMTFDHALCVYRIYIYCMQDSADELGWGQLKTMTIEDMPTSCTITLPKEKEGAGAKRFTIGYSTDAADISLDNPENNIYFDPGERIPVGLSNRRMVAKCIAAPPTNGLLNISLTTSQAQARQRVSIARNFQAGHAYDIVLRFSDHGLINADVSVQDWQKHDHDVTQDVAVDMYYDLSKYGTANCYLINSANYGYSFNATVKGNGDSSLVGNIPTTLNPGWIDILWDDMPPLDNGKRSFELVSNKLSNNRVLFKLHGNATDKNDKTLKSEGNVVIAAYSDATKSEILWTWHLWITDRVNIHGNPNGYLVQDRNLGAIAAAPENGSGTNMYGLYYQWGRPTPFRTQNPPTAIEDKADTPEDAVKNPTIMYGKGYNDWLATTNNSLWGYQNDFTKVQKTIYDPCPQGYMLADRRVWESVAIYQAEGGWQPNGLGAKIEISGNTIWYPIQGYIGTDGVANTAINKVRMWSSVVDINKSNNPFELQYNASSSADATPSEYRNVALPVRCVSGHSAEAVTNLSGSQTANCYIVHRSGYFKFKVTTRGNGLVQLLTSKGQLQDIADGLSANISPAKVDFLWYQGDFNDGWSDNNNTPDEKVIPMVFMNEGKPDDKGYVTFYVGEFKKCNVGLAAYDSAGNILWSWHIWFTDKPAEHQSGTHTLMDRFLGATYAPTISGNSITFANNNQLLATYGFYYQWGKKDPFFGPREINSTDNTNNNTPQCSAYWTKSYNGVWTWRNTLDTAGQVRVSEAPATPLTFRKRSGGDTGNGSEWFKEDFLTGDKNQNMWGYGQTGGGSGQGYTKTVHDPCPPGYMAMYHHAWYNNGNGYTESSAGGATLSNEGNYHNRGIVLTKDGFTEQGFAWYPYTGYRNGGSGRITNVGTNGRIFTCMPYNPNECRYYEYSKEKVSQTHTGVAPAMAIRCMKD